MTESPQLTELPPQPVLSVRRRIPVSKLRETNGECLKLLRGQLEAQGLMVAGAPFVRYHHFDNQETDVEVGVPITNPAQSDGEVQASLRPGGPALTLWHFGPHDQTFGESYRRLRNGLTEQGREAAGPAWEVYEWLDIAAGPKVSPAEWHTQLVQPLRGKHA